MTLENLTSQLDKIQPNEKTQVNAFLRQCDEFVTNAKVAVDNLQKKYEINLSSIEAISNNEIPVSKNQQAMASIASDLYLQHIDKKIDINLDKLEEIAKDNPSNENLKLFLNAARFYAMSLQSFLVDAEGGVLKVNAHTLYAQQRANTVIGQLVNQAILPQLREITSKYANSKRFLFFDKANSGIANAFIADLSKMYYLENYLSYVSLNSPKPIDNTVYQDKNAELLNKYDAMLDKQNLRRFELEKTGMSEVRIERMIRSEQTADDHKLEEMANRLTTGGTNQKMQALVEKREVTDNSEKSFKDLYQCLNVFRDQLKQSGSVELLKDLDEKILNPIQEHIPSGPHNKA